MGIYFGSNAANNITGSDDSDDIFGYGGNDVLDGGLGDDTILGGSGDDLLIGGAGQDVLIGGTGSDTLSYAENDANIIVYLSWNGQPGGAFGGTAAGDFFNGIENVIGGSGDDHLYGDGNNNVLTGGDGEDYLSGGDGDDQLFGQDGNDSMSGGMGSDHHDGGAGNDFVSYDNSDAAVEIDLALFTASGGFAEGDTLQSIEELFGTEFNDTLNGNGFENSLAGGEGNDHLMGRGGDDGLFGQGGNDILEGGTESDFLDGGDGIDTASYRYAASAVSIAMQGIYISFGESFGDQLVSIENLTGSEFDDYLGGNAGANLLTGRGGGDILSGRGGGDTLIGGKGGDTMTGGKGGDFFDYTALNQAGDKITDFTSGSDAMRFNGAAFGGLAEGVLDESQFIANNSGNAQTAEHRFIYELDTGILRFDSNGSDAGGVTMIATLTAGGGLGASDILIV